MPDKLNILLITTDQHRADCYGFAGRRVQTPHLDAFAAGATRFDACITPNAVCQPARASMLTGLLPRTHGVRDNGIDLRAGIGEAGFAGQMAAAGWDTGFVGKMHFSSVKTYAATGRPECWYSSDRYGPDWHGPYMGFQHVDTMVGAHFMNELKAPPFGQHWEAMLARHGRWEAMTKAMLTRLPPLTDAPNTWTSALPPAYHLTNWITERTVSYLREHRERPFVLWASYPDPHQPFDCPEPWAHLHAPEDVDLPRQRTRDLERRPWWHRTAMEGVPATEDPAIREFLMTQSRKPQPTDEQLRRIIANYYGMISFIDHGVGHVLDALEAFGLTENTLVVYTSDHGEWLGDHGLILKGPMHYEGLLRVACMMQGPGIPAGRVVEDPVSTLDLPATFFDYAGLSPSAPWHSRSLRPLVEGRGGSRDFAYNEWDRLAHHNGTDMLLRTVRTRTHKLTWEAGTGAGELYDLVNDPEEMDNLFDDASAAPAQRELLDMIRSRPDDAWPEAEYDAVVGMA